jgi:hypothetical protein
MKVLITGVAAGVVSIAIVFGNAAQAWDAEAHCQSHCTKRSMTPRDMQPCMSRCRVKASFGPYNQQPNRPSQGTQRRSGQ